MYAVCLPLVQILANQAGSRTCFTPHPELASHTLVLPTIPEHARLLFNTMAAVTCTTLAAETDQHACMGCCAGCKHPAVVPASIPRSQCTDRTKNHPTTSHSVTIYCHIPTTACKCLRCVLAPDQHTAAVYFGYPHDAAGPHRMRKSTHTSSTCCLFTIRQIFFGSLRTAGSAT